MLKTVVLINIVVETVILYSGFFDKKIKNCILTHCNNFVYNYNNYIYIILLIYKKVFAEIKYYL